MTKTANSLAGYIALLRQLALLCKVGSEIAAAIARYRQSKDILISDLECTITTTFFDHGNLHNKKKTVKRHFNKRHKITFRTIATTLIMEICTIKHNRRSKEITIATTLIMEICTMKKIDGQKNSQPL